MLRWTGLQKVPALGGGVAPRRHLQIRGHRLSDLGVPMAGLIGGLPGALRLSPRHEHTGDARDQERGRQLTKRAEELSHPGDQGRHELEERDRDEARDHGRQRSVPRHPAPEEREDDRRTEGRGDPRPSEDHEPEDRPVLRGQRDDERDDERQHTQDEGPASAERHQRGIRGLGAHDLLVHVADRRAGGDHQERIDSGHDRREHDGHVEPYNDRGHQVFDQHGQHILTVGPKGCLDIYPRVRKQHAAHHPDEHRARIREERKDDGDERAAGDLAFIPQGEEAHEDLRRAQEPQSDQEEAEDRRHTFHAPSLLSCSRGQVRVDAIEPRPEDIEAADDHDPDDR